MWFQESFFKYTTGAIFVLIIIFLLYNVAPAFYPILWFTAAILLPILFSTFLYYLLRPPVNILNRFGIPRYLSILIVYFFCAVMVTVIIVIFGGKIEEEINVISNLSPEKLESLKGSSREFFDTIKRYLNFSTEDNLLINYIQKINTFVSQLTINAFSTLASIAIALILTPFVLYYFLRDDSLFSRSILRFVPNEFQEEVQKILTEVDAALSGFILAQATVAIVIGTFLYFGYLLVGLPEAFALALFAMVFYIIPILGTFIAIIPALIVGLTLNLTTAIKVVIVMFAAHFFETNLLTPRLMSKMLKIHPLTVIFLLLAAGTLYGLLGLLLVTPTYAILKVIVWNIYKISRLRYTIAKKKSTLDPKELV